MNKIYSTKSCMKCLMMKKIFNEVGEEFEEIDLSSLEEKDLNEVITNANGSKSLPVVFYKGIWYGGEEYTTLKNKLLGRKNED